MKQRYLSVIVWGATGFHLIFPAISISANPLTKSIKNGIGAIKQAAAETKVIRKILSAVSQQVTEAEKSGNPNTAKQGSDTHSTLVEQPTKHTIKVHSQYKPWPQQIIPYDLSKITEKEIISKIQDAMKKWEERTGIHFIDKTRCRSAHDYLQFQLISQNDPRAGVAKIGYGKGVRKVLLNHTDEPTILHELGHSIGLDHEHNRSDRDSYINPSC